MKEPLYISKVNMWYLFCKPFYIDIGACFSTFEGSIQRVQIFRFNGSKYFFSSCSWITIRTRIKDWDLKTYKLVGDFIWSMWCCVIKLEYCTVPPVMILFLKLKAQFQYKVPYSFGVIVSIVNRKPYFTCASNCCNYIEPQKTESIFRIQLLVWFSPTTSIVACLVNCTFININDALALWK